MDDKEYLKGIVTGILIAACSGVGGYLGFQYVGNLGESVLSDPYHQKKIEVLEKLIADDYLDEVDTDDLAEGLYAGLIAGLGDAYSRYYTAEEYEELMKETDGSYVGIGILMQKYEDIGVEVVECYEGSPGDAAGLLKSDIILAVDGIEIADMELSEISSLIKNTDNDSVVLTVKREGRENTFELEVLIRDVEMKYVSYKMYDETIGYMAVTEFTGVTAKQYREAFETLESQGMEKLIVDLRGNPGGLYTSVCEILDDILPESLIVYTEDKYGEREERWSDAEAPLAIEMAVLVNGNSASASEIFAGAIQDHEAGIIVGTTTYGKGVVQSIYHLEDGSAVKLTVSKYYTPNGMCIHEVGIVPDLEVELDTEAYLEEVENSIEEEIWDNQVEAAVEALQSR